MGFCFQFSLWRFGSIFDRHLIISLCCHEGGEDDEKTRDGHGLNRPPTKLTPSGLRRLCENWQMGRLWPIVWAGLGKGLFSYLGQAVSLCTCNFQYSSYPHSHYLGVGGIHSKSGKVCGVCFSVSQHLRKRCVNLDDNILPQRCVNHQISKNFVSKAHFCWGYTLFKCLNLRFKQWLDIIWGILQFYFWKQWNLDM